MLRALAGQPAPEELIQLISRETDGNPFFVEEVYCTSSSRECCSMSMAACVATCGWTRYSVPESIRLVLGQRLYRLASSTRDVMVAAAVSGRMFASELVGDVADASASDGAGRRFRRKRSEPGSSHPAKPLAELMFSHELIRQTLLSGVSAVKRERLHLRTARGNLAASTPTTLRHMPGISPTTCLARDDTGIGPAWFAT